MEANVAFNMTVCILGIGLFLIHAVNLLLKKNRRKDEDNLLYFVLFTTVHFITYLVFTIIKINYTSDTLIVGFYTTFFIMNNVQILFLLNYALSYVSIKKKTINTIRVANIVVLVTYVILDIVNIFNHMFFYSVDGVYTRASTMIFSQGYQFLTFGTVLAIVLFNRKVNISEKIAFSIYCLLPLVAIIIQNLLPGFAVAYLSIIISVEILFLFVNVKKDIALINEERKSREMEITLMMSQIEPHFIYNTLSSISTLIMIDPEKAQKGLDNFTEYLRGNIHSISGPVLISFEDELRHIETYIALEKMRFDERINVVFDISDRDFLLPPLCIQPLVENAIKHGILQKIEGGTVKIKTYNSEFAHTIEISDDGVGFDVEAVKDDGTHIGISNVKHRLQTMCKGDMLISSVPGQGTNVTVKILK